MRLLIFFAMAMLFSISVTADPKSNLDTFKALKGVWSIKEGDKLLPIEMTYDLGSRDSVVTEHFGKELSVFYINKNELWMTHYCNRGNQPRLKLVPSKSVSQLEFEMIDISNLESSEDPHVQTVIYTMSDPTHLSLELVWKIGSQSKSEKYNLTKK